ncbi:PAS domain-containing protein [Cystobacter fuscus]
MSCLGTLLQSTGLGLAFLDRDSRFHFVSTALIGLSGLPGTAYEGRSVAEVWPGLAPALMPLLQRAQAGESIQGSRVSGAFGSTPGNARHFRLSLFPAPAGRSARA